MWAGLSDILILIWSKSISMYSIFKKLMSVPLTNRTCAGIFVHYILRSNINGFELA